jgi:hypothetical protein
MAMQGDCMGMPTSDRQATSEGARIVDMTGGPAFEHWGIAAETATCA